MEDVLEVYHRQLSREVLVCLDEASKQPGDSMPPRPGAAILRLRISAQRVSNLFMLFAPLEGGAGWK